MDGRADGDVQQREGVADAQWRFFPALDRVAYFEPKRRQDVALLAVLVMDEGDAGAAVGVVLDGRDLAGNAVLVALEVDLSVELAVAAALVACGDAALVVAAGVGGQRFDERLLGFVGGDLVESGDGHESASGAGWLELSNRHSSVLNAPEEPFDLLTLAERDDCLFPIGGVACRAGTALAAALLAPH